MTGFMPHEGTLAYTALDYGRAIRVTLPDGREIDIDMRTGISLVIKTEYDAWETARADLIAEARADGYREGYDVGWQAGVEYGRSS